MSSEVVVFMGYGPGFEDVIDEFLKAGAKVYVGTSAEVASSLPTSESVVISTVDFTSYESVAGPIQTAYKAEGRVDTVVSFMPEVQPALSSSLPSNSFTPDLTLSIYLTRLATYFFFESAYSDWRAKPKGSLEGVGLDSETTVTLVEKREGGGGRKFWLLIVGPEPPVAGQEADPLEAAQANGLLGYVRSLAVQATAERFGVALICAPKSAGGPPIWDALVQARAAPVPTDPRKNNAVYVPTGGKGWQRLSTDVGQFNDMPHIQALGFRIGVAMMIGGALKHSIRAQSIVLKRYSSAVRLGTIVTVALVLLLAGQGMRNWTLLIAAFAATSSAVNPKSNKISRAPGEVCSVGVFLGSGGHTGEAIQLLTALDTSRYNHRTYIYCTGDTMSINKAVAFEVSLDQASTTNGFPNYTFLEVPRARKVHQSKFSAVFTTIYSFLFAVWKLVLIPAVRGRQRMPLFDVLLVNGPGTCVAIVAAFLSARLLGFPTPKIIYVESFARVDSLSLSGKILKPFVDRFIVQWDQDANRLDKGWLV